MIRALTLTLGGLVLFVLVFHYLFPVRLWLAARNLGARVTLGHMITLANHPSRSPRAVLGALVSAARQGVDLGFEDAFEYAATDRDTERLVRAVKTARAQGAKLPTSELIRIALQEDDPAGANYRLYEADISLAANVVAKSADGVELKAAVELGLGFDDLSSTPESVLQEAVSSVVVGLERLVGQWSAEQLEVSPRLLEEPTQILRTDSGRPFELVALNVVKVEPQGKL